MDQQPQPQQPAPLPSQPIDQQPVPVQPMQVQAPAPLSQPIVGAQQPMPQQMPGTPQANPTMPINNPSVAIGEVDFYRKYWIFGAILIFMPFGVFIGLILLLNGDIYRKDKSTGQYQPISSSEKRNLIIVAVILQAFMALRLLG